MFVKSILWTTVAMVVLGLGVIANSTAEARRHRGANSSKKHGKNRERRHHGGGRGRAGGGGGGGMPRGIYIRITAVPSAFNDSWGCRGHSAADVIKLIEKLKPNVINRFVTGSHNPSFKVPGGSMTYTQFIDAAQKAGAPGCIVTPKVHLNKIWTDAYRIKAAESLRNLAVTPRLHALDLDCSYDGGAAQYTQFLRKLKAMGWSDLGFNFAGGIKKTHGMGSYGIAAINPHSGALEGSIASMRREARTILAHIDYPRGIAMFKRMSPDHQASVLRKIAHEQHKQGFIFIYPVIYSGYDSTKIKTHSGKTIFQVIQQLIAEDRGHK